MYKSDGAPNYIKLCFEVGLAKRSPRFLMVENRSLR